MIGHNFRALAGGLDDVARRLANPLGIAEATLTSSDTILGLSVST